MKIALTEKQLKSIASKLTSETDVDEQNEPVSAEPKSGASDKQSGGQGYPEVTTWSDIVGKKITRGPANQLGNTKWSETIAFNRGADNQLKEHVFDAHITTNGRYLLLQDCVFDIQEQKDLGNIWDSIDTFKTIFKNTESEEEGYKEIQEGILNLPLLESGDNLHALKQIILEFDLFKDTWIGRELTHAGTSLRKFGKDSWEGIRKMGVAISQGEWNEVLKLLKQGVLFIVRKLRQALFSDVGMIVEAILLATGIGKVSQVAVWGLVIGLDIYEMTSGNYDIEYYEGEPKKWETYLQLGLDIMAMIVAANAIKPIKAMFDRLKVWLKKGGNIADWFRKTPKAKETVQKIIKEADKAPSYLKRAQAYLKRKFPKGAEFLNDKINSLAKMIGDLKKTLGDLIKGTTKTGKKVRKGIASGGLVGGLNYGMDALTGELYSQSDPKIDYTPSLATMPLGDEF